ncbi:hypothetical protein KGF57_000443 [Candida theae]|uniref:Striatin N-terminal domain-containing protein n=1 Tax=Candida theae TaxID=1198502 RepID=A0AAD5BIY8_9ASCO|nr:uncharacterized protein KGF57_000443 [Candida theae]KAI5967228.1 hypothetical protein KGF57_000443 [Candida theae]
MPPRSNRPMNSQTQWKDQASSSSPPNSNEPSYTLPGVINYLTSEFTNLERFRIMTNLEKSEMKYKIIHLEGEIKTLKYANQKQQARIESLEKENQLLKSKSKETLVKEVQTITSTSTEPDLESIKKSRIQLADSSKEIMTLLKSSSTRLGDIDLSEENQREIEDMIDNSADDFVFGRGMNSPKSHMIAKFFEDDVNFRKDEESADEDNLERSITNESDVTVIDKEDEEENAPKSEVKNEDVSQTRSFVNDGVTTVLRIGTDKVTISTSGSENTTAREVSLSHPEDIRNVIALPNESYLVIENDIKLLADGSDLKILIPTKSSFSQISGSALIDMSVSGDKTNTYGLAISGVSNGTKSFLSKVYQISFNGQAKHKEIGSFNRKFLTKNKGGSEISFVGWRFEKTKSAPSSPSKNGNKNGADPRLAQYYVVFRIGDENYKVNLSLKQVVAIED